MSPYRVRIHGQHYNLPQGLLSLQEDCYDLSVDDSMPTTLTVNSEKEVTLNTSKDSEDMEYLSAFFTALIEVLTFQGEAEMIDWYSEPHDNGDGGTSDASGEVVCALPRHFVHDHNLMHKGIGLLVLSQNRKCVFMHKRSSQKRTWPGLLDSLVGGVCYSGESSLETAEREMSEELGLFIHDSETEIEFVGTTVITTTQNHCYVDAFVVVLDESLEDTVSYPDGEVEWGKWIAMKEMKDWINDNEQEFVPSGLQVWRYLESRGKV
jgi:isopentenyldiphosphate isomerase